MTVAGPRQGDGHVGDEMTGMRAEHHDTIRHLHGLLDVVRHDEHRLDGTLIAAPHLEHLVAQVLGRQHIQCGERLVHEQRIGLHHQGPCDAHALAHAAGELLRVRVLESVQSDGVDGLQCSATALLARHAAGLQPQFHIRLHREPRHQREGLEHESHSGIRAGDVGAAVGDGTARRGYQARQDAQERGFSGAGPAQDRHDLALMQGEGDVAQHGQLFTALGTVGLAHVPRLDDRGAGGVRRGGLREGCGVVGKSCDGHDKWSLLLRFLRMIAADSNDMRSPPILLDCCGSMGRDGRCGLRQATEKRRSAYACNGRQNSRLAPTTNTLITATPMMVLPVSPTAVALAIYVPNPFAVSVVCP